MGMFDSFKVQIGGHRCDLQSKRFNCKLNEYDVGDAVDGSWSGAQVFFDFIWLDKSSGRVGYTSAQEDQKYVPYTCFIIIMNSVYAGYEVEKGELDEADIERRIKEIALKWSGDCTRLCRIMAKSLWQKQESLRLISSKLSSIEHLLTYFREGKHSDGRPLHPFMDRHPFHKRLSAGEDPLEIILEIIKEPDLMIPDFDFDEIRIDSWRL